MATSKLMRIVLMSTSHETAFPEQELNRSIENNSRCISAPLTTSDGALVAQRPVRIDKFGRSASELDLWPRGERVRVGSTDVDRVGPGEDLLGPGLLRLQDRHVLRIVLRLGGVDRIPGLELVVEYRLRRLDEFDATGQQLRVVVGVLRHLDPLTV